MPKASLALAFVLLAGLGLGVTTACSSDDPSTTTTDPDAGASSSTSSSSSSSTSSSGSSGDAAAPADGGSTSSGGDAGKKALAEACTDDPDCASNVCFKGNQGSYCSLQCTNQNAATVCVAPFDGTCNKQGYCRKP